MYAGQSSSGSPRIRKKELSRTGTVDASPIIKIIRPVPIVMRIAPARCLARTRIPPSRTISSTARPKFRANRTPATASTIAKIPRKSTMPGRPDADGP
jgi:hypothetical protein